MEPVLSAPRPLSETELRFHLEEYRTLRSNLQHEKKSYVEFFLYSVAASGAIAAWVLTHKPDLLAYGPVVAKLAAAIPLVVTGLAFYMSWAVTSTVIARMGQYIGILETRAGADGLGWETYLSRQPTSLGIGRKMLRGWGALLLVDIALILVA